MLEVAIGLGAIAATFAFAWYVAAPLFARAVGLKMNDAAERTIVSVGIISATPALLALARMIGRAVVWHLAGGR